ncbi:MAG: CocE/NonD family hydrolase, partial [Pseudomonadota bacterium]
QIASRRPPALKAIMPIAGTDNRFTDDAHYVGGLLGLPNLDWGILMKSVMAGPPDPSIVGDAWEAMWQARLDATPSIIARWVQHQRFDSYWQRGAAALNYGAIQCPTYIVAGWLDTYSNPVGRLLKYIDVPKKALIGPWTHTYPEVATPIGVDWQYEEVRWWYHWLLGEETGIMAEPMLWAFMPYSTAPEYRPEPVPGRWIAETQWPSDTITSKKLWLSESGLTEVGPSNEKYTFKSDIPIGRSKPEWLDRLPGEQSPDDKHSLVFDSEPLQEDLEIFGYPQVHLRIAADKPVASLTVRLTDVLSERQSWLVSYVIRNLTHRDTHIAPSLLEPGQFYNISLPLFMTAHRFKTGHRIRIAISDGLWPMTCPILDAATLTIDTVSSFVELPVRPVEAEPQALPFDAIVRSNNGKAFEVHLMEADESGRYHYQRQTPEYSYAEREVGTILSTTNSKYCELLPNSESIWRHHIRQGWQRGDWHCAIEADIEVAASINSFRVKESLYAYKSGERFFEKTTDEEIERNML